MALSDVTGSMETHGLPGLHQCRNSARIQVTRGILRDIRLIMPNCCQDAPAGSQILAGTQQ